jgi:hypothetical protein
MRAVAMIELPEAEDSTNHGANVMPIRVLSQLLSKMNVQHAILHNRTGHEVFLSLSFADYVDHKLQGYRGRRPNGDVEQEVLEHWLRDNIGENRQMVKFIGTGPKTDDMIQLC